MIVDLFAGCGGWDVGARLAGLPDPIGFELDPSACATRVAAGMPTIRADLDGYPPRGRIVGLIASPPCTDFSTAGKQAGRDGDTGHLVDVPLAWALALEPDWLAWEQVPPVLPIWKQHAAVLERAGYLCWTGIVCAADHGVPQTRRRAVLLARRDRRPCPPMHTHCETGGLFTERWVSMADALGWGRLQPSLTLNANCIEHGRSPIDGSTWARAKLAAEQERGEWVVQAHNYTDSPAGRVRQERGIDEPAQTMAATGRSWRLRPGSNNRPTIRTIDEPAPIVAFGHDSTGWCWERPATAVCADPRLSPPGYRGRPDDYDPDGTYNGERSMDHAIRLTVRDALILQSFPPDFPVQGTRTAQFRQIGNAVPPRLAQVLLEAVSGP